MKQQIRLTDKKIAEIFYGLSAHYKKLNTSWLKKDPKIIYQALYQEIQYALLAHDGSLCQLHPDDHAAVYTILETFFCASESYQALEHSSHNKEFFTQYQSSQPSINYRVSNNHYYDSTNEAIFQWIVFRELLSHRSRSTFHWWSSYVPWFNRNEHKTSHHHDEQQKKQGSPIAVFFGLLALVAIITAGLLALYYLLREIANSVERFWYSEGWLQAGVTMMTVAGAACATTMLSMTFALNPIIALGVAAGVASPLGLAMFATISIALIGTALITATVNLVQSHLIKQANLDAFDPDDPRRYEITPKEASQLEEKGIDPIKVKCAIVALRAEIGDEPANRLFSRRSEQLKQHLEVIRCLRRGRINCVRVGSMTFDCRQRTDYANYPTLERRDDTMMSKVGQYQQSEQNNIYPAVVGAWITPVVPSAPPADDESYERSVNGDGDSAPSMGHVNGTGRVGLVQWLMH